MASALSTDPAPHDVVHTTLARLHTWIDYVPQPQRRLGKFIFLAAVIHVAAFFFILIDNSRPEFPHTLRTQVTLDSGSDSAVTSSNNVFWDKVTDPRLYLLPEPSSAPPIAWADPMTVLRIHARPVALPAPAEIGTFPFLNQPLPSLTERIDDALQPDRQPFTYRENAAPMAHATTWQWADSLADRAPANVPTLPSPVSDTEIQPTRLRVAVTPEGTVSDVLLDQSSTKPDLDQQAILAAQKVRFQRVNEKGTVWGLVTIAWFYTPKPQEITPPPAPLAP